MSDELDETLVRRWLPMKDTLRQGVELLGPRVQPLAVAGRLRWLSRQKLGNVAFLVVPIAAMCWEDVKDAAIAAEAAKVGVRVCLSADYRALSGSRLEALETQEVGFMLEVADWATPMAAFVNQSVWAIRFDVEFATLAGRDIRGAIWIDTLTRFAKNAGIASLGPSFHDGAEALGLPVRFDYVPKGPLLDVLEKHRLKA